MHPSPSSIAQMSSDLPLHTSGAPFPLFLPKATFRRILIRSLLTRVRATDLQHTRPRRGLGGLLV
jgi:hypothetical protein